MVEFIDKISLIFSWKRKTVVRELHNLLAKGEWSSVQSFINDCPISKMVLKTQKPFRLLLNLKPMLHFFFQEIPWKSFFKSSAVWAMIYTHFCGSWGHYTCLSWLPTYFR